MITNFYNVIITPTAYREISRIYEYITEDLCAGNAAKRIMKKSRRGNTKVEVYT